MASPGTANRGRKKEKPLGKGVFRAQRQVDAPAAARGVGSGEIPHLGGGLPAYRRQDRPGHLAHPNVVAPKNITC